MNEQEILPEPEAEITTEQHESPESVRESVAAANTERNPGATAGLGVVTAAAVDDAQSQVQGVVQDDTGISSVVIEKPQLDAPDVAGDLDLIESEWVRKAKEIVNATQGDPYSQNKRINEIKVDYIKKRYNQAIKLRK